mmetsp:Transcript_20323/g.42334  ORF Transcript_20323/g.42334 Transcript_20323/m.42334 type:complete len:393 (+) Transcript_20323:408-1586(+)
MSLLESNNPEQTKKKKDAYWEATPDKSLEGKTLSTLDISTLGNPSEESAAAKPPPKSPSPVAAEEPGDDGPQSYWDAPKEASLQGKTLSTLDMSLLESNNPEETKGKKDQYWEDTTEKSLEGKTLSTLDMTMLEANNPEEKQEKKDSYWEATPEESLKGRTLSTLSMSMLDSNNPEEKKEKSNSYWEAPQEKKLEGKTLSTIDMATLETNTNTDGTSAGAPSYWDDAPIDKSLEGKTLSKLDMAAMAKQHTDEDDKKQQSSGEAPPYWDWKVKAIKKTLSKISLGNLRKGSAGDVVLDDDDRVHGACNGSNNDNPEGLPEAASVKPITKKKHRLRDSWRKSFQRLSTNTLDQLDESNGSGPRLLGKRIFTSRNALDVSGGSQASISEDAIMF